MNLSLLTENQVWLAGSSLWIVGEPGVSKWADRVDWYLNFRLSHGWKSQSAPRSPEMTSLLEKLQWSLPQSFFKGEISTLLAPSNGRLPCDWILSVKGEMALETAIKTWNDLAKPKTRFFLNAKINLAHVQQAAQSLTDLKSFEFATDF